MELSREPGCVLGLLYKHLKIRRRKMIRCSRRRLHLRAATVPSFSRGLQFKPNLVGYCCMTYFAGAPERTNGKTSYPALLLLRLPFQRNVLATDSYFNVPCSSCTVHESSLLYQQTHNKLRCRASLQFRANCWSLLLVRNKHE